MRRFSHAFAVEAPLDRVWAFYTDIGHLEEITPPEMGLKVLRCTTGRQIAEGTEVWLEGKLVLKSQWHSRITRLKPYIYVDEMLEGRFRVWKHTHSFEQNDSIGNITNIIDEIDFELRYGLLGKKLEGYTERQLKQIFAHRKNATIKALR